MSQRFTVQISNQLNAWLEEQARLNHRSKNKQIEYLLDTAMQNQLMDVARLDFHHLVDEEMRQGWVDWRTPSGASKGRTPSGTPKGRRQGEK